jgi:haloacetate dehalogenase
VFQGFENGLWQDGERRIPYVLGGSGPPLLLLHGFPQTHAMWAEIAPVLAQRFTVIATDLRGYGASHKPKNISSYSFRELGHEQFELMTSLGFDRFHLVGHDRGGRTAHRMALDAPKRVLSLTVMDIVPTHLLLDDLSKEVARSYYHWFFLAQPEPLPEQMILADPDLFFESCLLGWGSARIEDFAPTQLAAYRKAWRDGETVRGMCNDYRAAIAIDFVDDAVDLGRRVECPTLVMFGADGAMAGAYDVPATWRPRCTVMKTAAIPGGHFFPDTSPHQTAQTVLSFLETL